MGGGPGRQAGGLLTAPGGDERAALAGLLACWGRDWPAARAHLITLLLAGGRLAAADALAEATGMGDGAKVGDVVEPSLTVFGAPPGAGKTLHAVSTGWRCPGCSRCHAPAVAECPHCRPPATSPPLDEATKKAAANELKRRYVRGHNPEVPE